MNRYKLLTLISALSLTGCSEDYMSLHFDKPVGSWNHKINHSMNKLLTDTLRSRGVDVDKIELALDKEDTSVIHLSVDGDLKPEQRVRLRALFDEIVTARAASSMTIDLELEAQPGASAPQLTPFELTVSPQPELTAQYKLLDRTLAAYNDTQLPVQIYCNIKGELNGKLLFSSGTVQQIPEQSPEHVYLHYKDNIRLRKVRARMLVRDADLRESINKGEIRLWNEVLTLNHHFETNLQLAIQIAKLGDDHASADVRADQRLSDWLPKCTDKIQQLGRPFTFHMGSSLDRLKAVTYQNAESS
ncbi:hypothetical protein N5D52_03150 [Pseudomonas sp. GD03860]|uniref:hypothetical protein n=1 Tax=Pseudomonas TaxID=286 RepID=UPI002363BB65|nr:MULTISPECIES: hypothetical protein [Pseudomonas]MDD2057610.1 hypothetical protein [Pseudomonas putida]MDH0635924.1 hypothetical protein [Pseudomonas sp. GD03860]